MLVNIPAPWSIWELEIEGFDTRHGDVFTHLGMYIHGLKVDLQ